jgi:hypothetical protein
VAAVLSGLLPTHPVVMKQPERVVKPVFTPLLPPEPLASLGAHQVPPNLPLHPLVDKRKALARVACREVVTQPRRMGLICSITLSTGWLRYRRKTILSFANSAVRFFSLGTYWGHHFPNWLRIRWNSNPRKWKLSPFDRSAVRLFSSLISTLSLTNSSRTRLATALTSQSCRGWKSINNTSRVARGNHTPGAHRSGHERLRSSGSYRSTVARCSIGQ